MDLLVIVPHSDESFYTRTARAYRSLGDIDMPIDVRVYTAAEFEARSTLSVSFEKTVRSPV